MKKVLYLAFLVALLASRSVQAQITPENAYQGSGYMIRLSSGDYKYQMLRSATNQLTLYSLNHAIYKQFTVPSGGAGYSTGNVSYVSDALFDTNPANVEYAVSYSNSSGPNTLYKTVIYSETGTQLALLDSTTYIQIYNTPGGTKMLASKFTYATTTGTITREYTRIYTLGGHLALRTATPTLPDAAGAYPNPAQSLVNLPYSVPAGQTGSLKVYDISGRVVGTYQVDSHINHLEMGTRDLRPGVYLYTVETLGGVSPGQRFIIK
jgi:hypothetical protein